MATQRSNEAELLGIIGSVSMSAGTMVGTVVVIGRGTVVVVGRKIAEYGVRGMAIVRRNALRARVAALEFSLAAVKRGLKKARKRWKSAEPKEETQGEQAKTKAAVKAQKPQPRIAGAWVFSGKLNRTATPTELKAKTRRPQSKKAGVKTKAAVKAKKSQPRVAKAKTAVSTKLKAKAHRPQSTKAGVKTKAAVKAKKSQPRVAKAKIKKATAKPKRSSRPRKRPKPKAGVKTKAAVKAKKSQPRVAKTKTAGDKPRKTATSTELKTKIHRLEGELEDLKYPPVELEDELFEE